MDRGEYLIGRNRQQFLIRGSSVIVNFSLRKRTPSRRRAQRLALGRREGAVVTLGNA